MSFNKLTKRPQTNARNINQFTFANTKVVKDIVVPFERVAKAYISL